MKNMDFRNQMRKHLVTDSIAVALFVSCRFFPIRTNVGPAVVFYFATLRIRECVWPVAAQIVFPTGYDTLRRSMRRFSTQQLVESP